MPTKDERISAEVVREATPPDLDGRRWELRVSDGIDDFAITVQLAGSASRGHSPREAEVAEAFETYAAAAFPDADRLSSVVMTFDACGPYLMKVEEDLTLVVYRRALVRAAA